MSGFHGAFARGVACQQGTLTLPDTRLSPTFWDIACAPVVETRFLELAMSLLDFSPWIPLGSFSICLVRFLKFKKRLLLRCNVLFDIHNPEELPQRSKYNKNNKKR